MVWRLPCWEVGASPNRKLIVSITAASLVAVVVAAALRRKGSVADVGKDGRSEKEEAELELSALVAKVSEGRLKLKASQEKGRYLVATQELKAGTRIKDLPIAPCGTDLGRHLLKALEDDALKNATVGSGDLLAALDFLASVAQSLATAKTKSEQPLLRHLFRFDDDAPKVPMIRRWHSRFRAELRAAVTVPELEDAWQHVVPNWRRLVAVFPEVERFQPAPNEDGSSAKRDETATPTATGTATGTAAAAAAGGGAAPSTPTAAAAAASGAAGGAALKAETLATATLAHRTICGLWLLMVLCEHSCDPTCALYHDGRDLYWIVLRDVLPGEAVTSSYLNLRTLLKPTQARREALDGSWDFICSCDRCEGTREREEMKTLEAKFEADDDLFDAYRKPPGEDEDDRRAFCNKLQRIQTVARTMFQGKPEPVQFTLQLLQALFAPSEEGHQKSCRDLVVMSQKMLPKNSPQSVWAELLLHSPASLLLQKAKVGNDSQIDNSRSSSSLCSSNSNSNNHLSSSLGDVNASSSNGVNLVNSNNNNSNNSNSCNNYSHNPLASYLSASAADAEGEARFTLRRLYRKYMEILREEEKGEPGSWKRVPDRKAGRFVLVQKAPAATSGRS